MMVYILFGEPTIKEKIAGFPFLFCQPWRRLSQALCSVGPRIRARQPSGWPCSWIWKDPIFLPRKKCKSDWWNLETSVKKVKSWNVIIFEMTEETTNQECFGVETCETSRDKKHWFLNRWSVCSRTVALSHFSVALVGWVGKQLLRGSMRVLFGYGSK